MGSRHSPTSSLLRRAHEAGQISLLAALMIGTTFFLFLAFVVNTGMVVHAKINLQNAADVAAYAGAATQARQLNQIAILNYEMRRQYKKFLYRYAVYGSAASMNQPQGQGPVNWGPNGTHKVPAVCITYDATDNYCQLQRLPKIAKPDTVGFLDSIGQAANQIYDQIEQLRRANCEQLGITNSLVLFLWLYNTEAEQSSIINNLGQSNQARNSTIYATLQAITRGLGLVPKNLLLKKRIDSLAKFVNYQPAKNFTANDYDNLAAGGDFFARERTLQAFQSALQTLGPQVFNQETFFFDELLPEGSSLLDLETVYSEFDTFSVQPEFVASLDGCVQHYFHIPVRGRTLPVSVHKKPGSRNVYYAVRLRAKARVLFSPFGDLEMTAYSAAKPFGSRIGPVTRPEDWIRFGKPSSPFDPHSSLGNSPLLEKVPNLAVMSPDEGTSRGKGWDNGQVFSSLFATTQAASGNQLTEDDFIRAQQAAMGPFQSERGKYVIPVDIEGAQGNSFDEAKEYFRYFGGKYRTTFYAPIADRETPGLDPRQEVDDAIQTVQVPPAIAPSKTVIQRGLTTYFASLRNTVPRGTDELESYHFAKISNPLKTPDGQPVRISGGDYLMTSGSDLRTSWGGVDLAPSRTDGRIGYSVKFISFQSLKTQGLAIDDSTETVLDMIQH